MQKLKSLFIAVFLMGSVSVYSQIGVTSYSIHSLGISTGKEKRISGELKSFFNRGDIENTYFELSGMYNFRSKEYHQFSAGLGLNILPFTGFDPIYSFSFPVQLEIFPLQNFRQLSFVIELAPEFVVEEAFNVRHLWGIRYTFKKK